MYERSYGYKYAELGDHPTAAEIAKAVRANIKQAVGEGMLPAHWSYSVRSDSFAGGCSVDVDVRDCSDAWQDCDGTVPGTRHDHGDGMSSATGCPDVWCAARNDPVYAHAAHAHKVLTEEARIARMTLERLHNAYNHDGSEIMVDYFDVRYYGHVSFEDDDSARWRKEQAAKLAAKKTARESGKILGKVANYSRDGRSRVVHLLVETPDGKKVLGCGARTWHLGGGLADDRLEVTCSRCAKRANA